MKSDEKNFPNQQPADNQMSRKDFLKKSLAAGMLLNLKYPALITHPNVAMVGDNVAGGASNANQQLQTNSSAYWHNKIRQLRYRPDGEDFVITNGKERFNRPVYGTNTAFRIQAGDLPEFALFMPGIGGTLKFGISSGNHSRWLNDAETITARYRPGSMIYEIRDPLLGKGTLQMTLLAMSNADGLLVRATFQNTSQNIRLIWAFGGASDDHFARNGDIIGADPVSGYYLLPDHCKGNEFYLEDNTFQLRYGRDGRKKITGVFPSESVLHLADAERQKSPQQFQRSGKSETPALAGMVTAKNNQPFYCAIYNPDITEYSSLTYPTVAYSSVPGLFEMAEKARTELTNRVRVSTPDPFINTFGGALSVAADAIWESPSYLHGAVAWRVRLNGWRGPYVADPLGWHDRARMHFSSYALSQLTSPESGPVVPDPSNHLARELMKLGTELYSSGYICPEPGGHSRADHYDMNLCYIDEMLWHFMWTGDWDYVKEMWPTLKRHLAWEKRCFDADDDGLYDAYCCIWASDAIEYNGGDVTHSSAYNYRANKLAAFIAEKIGEDPKPYRDEAQKIFHALNSELWLSDKGWYAEYKDTLGLKLTHPEAALWTIYHAIDSEVPDPFMAYQALRYVDTQIPHIPVRADELPDDGYFTLSTTNWLPYMWSDNNVVMAEIFHTSLAYWEAGRNEEAFKLWKSTVLDNMYMGMCPGNFEQLSFYDAIRGELYTDFGDPIGMAARSLVEGLFGITPNALKGEVTVHPGFPAEWDHASLDVPDISLHFKRTGNSDKYMIEPHFERKLELKFVVDGYLTRINKLTVNGKPTAWKNADKAVGKPQIEIECGIQPKYDIEIQWEGDKPAKWSVPSVVARTDQLRLTNEKVSILDIHDPQHTLQNVDFQRHSLTGTVRGETGSRTLFVKVRQGDFEWWEPICFEIAKPVEIVPLQNERSNKLQFEVRNNKQRAVKGHLSVNNLKRTDAEEFSIEPGKSRQFNIADNLITGTNQVIFEEAHGEISKGSVINWDLKILSDSKLEMLDLSRYFNDQVTNIFKNKYLSPRSKNPTLRIPTQGIGAWTATLVTADINDSGLRRLAGFRNKFDLPQGISFRTPGKSGAPNIVFTSQWDNYPDEVTIPVSGKASHAYLMMAGSTNWMQSRLVNGEVVVQYSDESTSRIELKNPDTWWPIEQDYYTDGYAFSIKSPKPIRVHLKTGLITREFDQYTSIRGYSDQVIEGGAATVLDLPLDISKNMESIKLKTLANDAVIGLMSVTLVRT